jgi:hypothetical protein
MLQAILEAIQCSSEDVVFLGATYTVRECDVSINLKLEDELEKKLTEADGASRADLAYWALVVHCIYKADGTPLFSAGDIPMLRKGSRIKLAPLLNVVDRLNGLNAEANAKK